MANDINIHDGGAIQPYEPSPSMQELQPLQPDTWDRSDLDTYQRAPSAPTLFGQPMPGATPQQIQQVLVDVGSKYAQDMTTLKYPSALVNHAISFMQNNATKPPRQVRRNHDFNLHSEAGDWLAEAFGNHLAGISGFTNHQKQAFLTASLKWMVTLNKQLASQQQVAVSRAQGSAPNSSSDAILSQLSDADFNKVKAINEKAIDHAKDILRQRWGDSYALNIALTQSYVDSLPAADHSFFTQFTEGWIQLRYTPEFWLGMFDAATGAHSIPKDGAGIAREIASIENCMKYERKKYMADPQLQARYRTLLDMKAN